MSKQVKVIEMNKETVIITYGIQALCLHNFGNRHKIQFEHFKEELEKLQKKHSPDLGQILTLARIYGVNVVSARYRP